MSCATIPLQVLILGVSVSVAIEVSAAAPRTFVASGGSDANNCSLVSPCRSFSAALAQTAAGGEIVVLDSAGYGPVVIDKAVAITAPEGVYAGVTVPIYGIGVNVAAGATDAVVLRGLSINGQGAGAGVKLTSGSSLVVDRCTIRDFAAGGFSPPLPKPPPPPATALQIEGLGRFVVRDSFFVRNSTAVMVGYGAGPYDGTIERSTFAETGSGIEIWGSIDLTVTDTVMSGVSKPFAETGTGIAVNYATVDISRIQVTRTSIVRFGRGIYVAGALTPSHVAVADSDVSQNETGIVTDVGGYVWLTGTRVTHNGKAVSAPSYPVWTSGTNFFGYNGTDGDPLSPPAGIK